MLKNIAEKIDKEVTLNEVITYKDRPRAAASLSQVLNKPDT
jgi:hypothetical protein